MIDFKRYLEKILKVCIIGETSLKVKCPPIPDLSTKVEEKENNFIIEWPLNQNMMCFTGYL